MTARSARETIEQALVPGRVYHYGRTPPTGAVTSEQLASAVLAALVGAGLDAHDWLALIGVEAEVIGWKQDDQWVHDRDEDHDCDEPPACWPVYRLGLRGSEE